MFLLESFTILNHAELQAQALDLVEMLRQKQLSQRRQMMNSSFASGSEMFPRSSDAISKQLGMLECVAKLPKLAAANGGTNLGQTDQQTSVKQLATDTTTNNSSTNGNKENNGPQIIELPPMNDTNNDDDEEDPQQQLEAPPPPPPPLASEENAGNDDDESVSAPLVDEESLTETDEGQETDPAFTDDADEQQQQESVAKESNGPVTYRDRRRKASRRSNWGPTVYGPKQYLTRRTSLSNDRERWHWLQPHHRSKRQASAAADSTRSQQQIEYLTNAIAQLITRALMNRIAQQRRQLGQLQAMLGGSTETSSSININNNNNSVSHSPQVAAPAPGGAQFQSVLSSVMPVGQLLATDILRQTVENIPVRMANVGRLIANLLTTLTVNNPILVNSPILTRLRNSVSGVGGLTSGSNIDAAGLQPLLLGVLTNTIRSLNIPDLQPLDQRLPRRISNSSLAAANQAQPAATIKQESTSFSVNNNNNQTKQVTTVSNKTRNQIEEEEFVERLNALTLGVMLEKRSDTNKTKSTRGKPKPKAERQVVVKAKSRQKRSLGTMLMFGPFSKLYMAMMMHRVMKYQTGVVSQAVMGELVRRYLIPGFSSALSGATGGQSSLVGSQQLLNQARQIFSKTTASLTGDNGASLALKQQLSGGQAPQGAPSELSQLLATAGLAGRTRSQQGSLLLQQLALLAPFQQSTDAECEFQQDGGPFDPIRFTTPLDIQRLYKLLQGPMSEMFTSALENPLVTIDPERGISINLPITQTNIRMTSNRLGHHQDHDHHHHNHHHQDGNHHGDPRNVPPELHQLMQQQQQQNQHHQHGGPRFQSPSRFNHQHRPGPFATRPNGGFHGQQHQFASPSAQPFQGRRPEQQQAGSFDQRPSGSQGHFQMAMDELLRQATPAQLMEMLAKLNSTAPNGTSPQTEGGGDPGRQRPNEATGSRISNEDQLRLLQGLMDTLTRSTGGQTDGRLSNNHQAELRDRDRAPTSLALGGGEPVSSLADKLLNKTLANWMQTVLMAQDGIGGGGGGGVGTVSADTRQHQSQPGELRPQRPLNGPDEREMDKLMLQMAGLINGKQGDASTEGLNAGKLKMSGSMQRTTNDTSSAGAPAAHVNKPPNQIQITLTSDSASSLMDKLRAISVKENATTMTPARQVLLVPANLAAAPDDADVVGQTPMMMSFAGDNSRELSPMAAISLAHPMHNLSLDFPQQQQQSSIQPPVHREGNGGAFFDSDSSIPNAETLFSDHNHPLGMQDDRPPPPPSPLALPPAHSNPITRLARPAEQTLDLAPSPPSQARLAAADRPPRFRAPYQNGSESIGGGEFMSIVRAAGPVSRRPWPEARDLGGLSRLDSIDALPGSGLAPLQEAEKLLHEEQSFGLRKVSLAAHDKQQLVADFSLGGSSSAAAINQTQEVSGEAHANLKPASLRLHSNGSAIARVNSPDPSLQQQLQQQVSPEAGSAPLRQGSNSSQQEPLNNLAMALNVMNMVMLNQRLMTAGNSSNWGLGEPARPASQTSISGNFSLNNSRITLPPTDTNELKPLKLAANGTLTTTQNKKLPHRDPKKSRAKSSPTGTPRQRNAATAKTRHKPAANTTNSSLVDEEQKGPVAAAKHRPTDEPEFVLLQPAAGAGRPRQSTNKSNSSSSSNHRTSTNAIRLHSNLSLAKNVAPSSSTTKPPKYIYQPLIVASGSNGNRKTAATQQQQAKNNSSSGAGNRTELAESEVDHAARWNDVLQHLDLAARS